MLMRGLSATLSFILLVAITIASTVLLYFWLVAQGASPVTANPKVSIQVNVYNSTVLKVVNIGVTNTSSLSSLNTTAGGCTFPAATVLMPGITYNCTLPSAASGEVRVWAHGVRAATVYV